MAHMKHIDDLYSDLVQSILEEGEWSENRTGIRTLFKIGHYMKIDCSEYFPLLTTKRVYWKSAFSEMLGFIRGYDNAAEFRKLGCKVWDQNANENKEWLENPYRTGQDDLGQIYGVQWRYWYDEVNKTHIDQLQKVITDLSNGVDNRREIITAWNPSRLTQMALPPCHYTMIFSLTNNKTTLDLSLFIRSNDVFLGNPYNISQYAFLLHLMARITNKKVGNLHYHSTNVHIYENHMNQIREQISRTPKIQKPQIHFHGAAKRLSGDDLFEFIETTDIPLDNWVQIIGYDPHPAIKAPMAV